MFISIAPPNVTSADIEAETEPDGSFQYQITTVTGLISSQYD